MPSRVSRYPENFSGRCEIALNFDESTSVVASSSRLVYKIIQFHLTSDVSNSCIQSDDRITIQLILFQIIKYWDAFLPEAKAIA